LGRHSHRLQHRQCSPLGAPNRWIGIPASPYPTNAGGSCHSRSATSARTFRTEQILLREMGNASTSHEHLICTMDLDHIRTEVEQRIADDSGFQYAASRPSICRRNAVSKAQPRLRVRGSAHFGLICSKARLPAAVLWVLTMVWPSRTKVSLRRHLKPRPHRRGFFMRATNASGAEGVPATCTVTGSGCH
jgi:hypothetical protein